MKGHSSALSGADPSLVSTCVPWLGTGVMYDWCSVPFVGRAGDGSGAACPFEPCCGKGGGAGGSE